MNIIKCKIQSDGFSLWTCCSYSSVPWASDSSYPFSMKIFALSPLSLYLSTKILLFLVPVTTPFIIISQKHTDQKIIINVDEKWMNISNIQVLITSILGWPGELECFSWDPERKRGNLFGEFPLSPAIFTHTHTLYLSAIWENPN